jgi:hypothetical protein
VGTPRNAMWRLGKLDDVMLYLPAQSKKSNTVTLQALVSRDKRLRTLVLNVPDAERPDLATWVLRVGDEARVDAWLAA